MDNETQPIEAPKLKARPRRERGKPTYTPTKRPEPLPDPAPKPPEVVDPSLGENDVRAQVIVKLTTRYGTHFINEDSEILGGFLDPAHRGHMSKVMEIRFEKMCAFVVRGFSQLMEERIKAEEAKPKEPPRTEGRSMKVTPSRPLNGGTKGEPIEEGKPPLPARPGAGFMPPLAPPPTTHN